MFLKKEYRVLFGDSKFSGTLKGDVVENITQMMLEDSSLANLASSRHQNDFSLLQAGIDGRFHLTRDVHGNGLLAQDASMGESEHIVNYRELHYQFSLLWNSESPLLRK